MSSTDTPSPAEAASRSQSMAISNPPGPSGPLQGQKSLFRIPMYKPTGTRSSSTGEHPTKREFRARRSHRKSRAGCLVCKTRRVKACCFVPAVTKTGPHPCDEAKPHCLRCQKHGVECVYTAPGDSTGGEGGAALLAQTKPGFASPDSRAYSMHLLEVSEKIDELLGLGSKKRQLPGTVGALHHFHNVTTPTVGAPRTQELLRQEVAELAFSVSAKRVSIVAKQLTRQTQTPFVMHTLIAVATSHLSHAVPDNTAYKLAEAYHWQRAIGQYSKELASGVGPHNMDSLFSTCLLMTVNSFALDEYNPRKSFVFSDDPGALSWLILQGGLRHLLGLTRPWLCISMWLGVFMDNVEESKVFDDHRPGRAGLHPALADICGIEDTTTEESNPYLWPLRMLTALLAAERSMKSFSMYTTFMGRLLPIFWDRLANKDPPALVILGWWLALLDSIGLWWAQTRVRSECAAICMYLEDSEDARVLRLLEFPAGVAGYLLKHVQDQTWEEDSAVIDTLLLCQPDTDFAALAEMR
ncbi:Zn(II)2Cys6 transcription factor domain-containing protein [Aspergillus clavatus NRRL 1]|uniref:C6 zinc finger domain protein n=1 Tax=Aspergillus clavatus (strain ATCC 1007 / CBS 513.65 / DSM 816 / NCTC 3887 / NRRL 1 / QM 1276 / 107) TaxID=344612 RepID=A1CEA3_ASPCL|nr:C6 zinc finger domain protein [Aspergillus clavatus NRRL 1]EAW11202.1 C6 zinc finger domain protein [Aspergillus clavatus NRRL 1]